MVEEHGIGRSQLGDLVQTATDEVSCSFAVAFRRKIWWLSIYNRLRAVSYTPLKIETEVLTLS